MHSKPDVPPGLADRVRHLFALSIQTKQESAAVLVAPITSAARLMSRTLRGGKKILCCGNGGSAADAQHFASELVNTFEMERPGLAALSLATDSSALTSIGNDRDFAEIFARQVAAIGQPRDALLAITTSGCSPNVNRAIDAAHARDMQVVLLTGKGGGRARELLQAQDACICVPADTTARIQEVHVLVIHCLCDLIDQQLMHGD